MIMLRKKPPNSEFEFGTSKKTPKFRIWICMLYFHNTNSNSEFVSPNLGHKFRIWICLFLAVQPYMVFYSKNWSLQSQRLAQFVGKYETKKEIYPNNMQSMYLSYTKYITLFCNFVFFQKPQLTLTVVQSTHPLSLGGSDWNNSITTQLAGGPEKKGTSQCWLAMLAAHKAFGLHIHIRMVAFEGYISLAMLATHLKMVSLVGCLWRLHLNSHVGYTFEKGQPGRLPLKATFDELCWLHIWKGSAL